MGSLAAGGSFFYENDTLRFIQHEEGRIVYQYDDANPQVYEIDYQYHLKDHLGNTRLTFSTTDEVYHFLTTFDSPSEANNFESGDWNQDEPAGQSGQAMRISTNEPSGGQFNGMAKLKHMISVQKGDTIKMEVFATYDPFTQGQAYPLDITDLFPILAGSYAGPTLGEGVTVNQSDFADPDAEDFLNSQKSIDDEDAPHAFLNFMFFDEDMAIQENGGFIQVSTNAATGWEKLELKGIAENNGYVLVYVSNETNATSVVKFDNYKITHVKTPVVQADSYYPFGLTYGSFERSYSEIVRFKFQDQEHDEETGWIQFKWRNHQPEIGRFFNLDPISEEYYYNSPYAFSENKLTAHVELEGLESKKSTNPYVRSLFSENVQKTVQQTNESSQNMISGSFTLQGAGFGLNAEIGPVEADTHVRTGSVTLGLDSDGDVDINTNTGSLSSGITVYGQGISGSLTGPSVETELNDGEISTEAKLHSENVSAVSKNGAFNLSGSVLDNLKLGFGVSIGNFAMKVQTDVGAFLNYVEGSAESFSAYFTDLFDQAYSDQRKEEEVLSKPE